MGKPIGSALDVKQLATPGTNPSSGSTRLYPKTDDNLYRLTSTGVETLVGRPPEGATIALIGASGTRNNTQYDDWALPNTTLRSTLGTGPFAWANIYLGHRLRLQYNLGVNGAQPSAILTQVDTLLGYATRPQYCMIGWDWSNGICNAAENSATTIGYLTTAINKLIGAGIVVILGTIIPRTDANTTAERQAIYETNNWMRDQAFRNGIIFVDTASAIIDPLTNDPKTGYTSDGVHPNVLGAQAIGRVIADALSTVVQGSRILLNTAADTRLISKNPMFTGTGGTLTSGTDGVIPADWVAQYVGTAGAAGISKVARKGPDGVNDGTFWLQITHTAINTGALWVYTGSTGGTWSIGDTVIGEMEFEVDDDVEGLTNFHFCVGFTSSPYNVYDVYDSGTTVTMLNPTAGVFRTPPMNIPSGTTDVAPAFISRASYGTIRIGKMAVRKV